MRIRKSLVSKYVLLILASILMWPVLPAIYYLPELLYNKGELYEPMELETMWKQAAEQLSTADEDTILEKLGSIQTDYPQATLFWVEDTEGSTHVIHEHDQDLEIPD